MVNNKQLNPNKLRLWKSYEVYLTLGTIITYPVCAMWWIALVILSVLGGTWGLDKTFPPGFKFGVATAAYQIEGGWNASDKTESIWDRVVHSHPELVKGGGNGDVACDSYHQWRRDVEMVHEMGLHFYRFSISWSRLLPNAYPTKLSESGKKYYNDLINYLLEKGIEPIITLYHWDLPQKLQDLGGWTNPLITDWFADYAAVVFSLYADRVKTWITINEPIIMCDLTYNTATYAPLILEPEMAGLLCNKHVLVAHAKAWRMYDEKYKSKHHGKMSIGNFVLWIEPKSEDDEELAELAIQSFVGQYSHPIYSKDGGWPPTVEVAMAKYSKKAGYPTSKLPAFTKEEIILVRGTYDFYGINYYSSRLARHTRPSDKPGIWPFTGHPDYNITLEVDPRWPMEGLPTVPSYPVGLRRIISWLRNQYGNIEFFVAENGCGIIEPDQRVKVDYIKAHLEQVLLSIKEDGSNITGYTYWSLMDNLEWLDGYKLKYGLYEVDFSDPKRTRTPRPSSKYYSRIVKTHSLDVPTTEYHRHIHKPRNTSTNNNVKCTFLFISVICLIKHFC